MCFDGKKLRTFISTVDAVDRAFRSGNKINAWIVSVPHDLLNFVLANLPFLNISTLTINNRCSTIAISCQQDVSFSWMEGNTLDVALVKIKLLSSLNNEKNTIRQRVNKKANNLPFLFQDPIVWQSYQLIHWPIFYVLMSSMTYPELSPYGR